MLARIQTVILLILISIISNQLIANDEITTLAFKEVLQLDRIEIPIAAFNTNDNYKEILNFETIDIYDLLPSESGAEIKVSDNPPSWSKATSTDGRYEFETVEKKNFAQVQYLAAYVSTDRWLSLKLIVRSSHLLKVFFDGENIGTKEIVENDVDESRFLKSDIKLESGKHLIIIKAVCNPSNDNDWYVDVQLEMKEIFSSSVSISVDPTRFMSVEAMLDNPKVTGVAISADGRYSAVSITKRNKKKDADESWIQIYSSQTGRLLNTYRGGTNIGTIKWAPEGNLFGYSTKSNDESFLWIVDFEKGETFPVLENVKNFGSFEWSPSGDYIIYTATEKGEAKDKDLKRFTKPQDRYPDYLDNTQLYKIEISTGTKFKITGGENSTVLNSVSDDGRWVVLSKLKYNFDERPYQKTEYFLLDLVTMKFDSIASVNWGGEAKISPDASQLLILAGPSSFGDEGIAIEKGKIPNDYDTQAYILNIATRKVTSITKNFDPKINSAYWSYDNRTIYFTTTDKSFEHLYKYETDKRIFSFIDLGVEVVEEISFAKDVSVALFSGSSSNQPRMAYFKNFITKERKLILDPDSESNENLKFGEVKNWVFKSKQGKEIFGRVYYPPDFSPFKKYPAIVYFYAGTSPVTREIWGRYPKNIWAANGYIVYVLQPSGTFGFGQDFSSTHVHDWGKVTAEEIIEGTDEFLKAHRFVDRKKIGCIGASYGGFMTMNLITKTDMFTAAVSHAGISGLTSYWGEGFWGYWYNSVAAANSFPWNRKDIYVDHSPIYNADKINTPLLLVHGEVDTNVPPGESYQMYTALKLLKKDVELLTVSEQDHHIMKYEKRKKWTKAIIAYFDKYLKNQPEWWNDSFGK